MVSNKNSQQLYNSISYITTNNVYIIQRRTTKYFIWR